MHLTPGVSKMKVVPIHRNPGRCHPDAIFFGRQEQRLYDIRKVTPVACMNGDRPRIVRNAANEDAIIAAV
jgi:hypothetical protein